MYVIIHIHIRTCEHTYTLIPIDLKHLALPIRQVAFIDEGSCLLLVTALLLWGLDHNHHYDASARAKTNTIRNEH